MEEDTCTRDWINEWDAQAQRIIRAGRPVYEEQRSLIEFVTNVGDSHYRIAQSNEHTTS